MYLFTFLLSPGGAFPLASSCSSSSETSEPLVIGRDLPTSTSDFVGVCGGDDFPLEIEVLPA